MRASAISPPARRAARSCRSHPFCTLAHRLFSGLLLGSHFQFERSPVSEDDEKLPFTTPSWKGFNESSQHQGLGAKEPAEMHPQKGLQHRAAGARASSGKRWGALALEQKTRGSLGPAAVHL